MADDVTITTGANATPVGGTIVAADEIGVVKYQRIKVTLGADGAADMDLDSGQQTMTNSVPVAIASNQSAVAVDATGQGDVPVTLDSEQVDVSDRAARDLGKVDVAGIDAIGAVAGQATMANSLPVTIASNQDTVALSANQQAAATAPTIYNVTMTNADAEYSQALPANTRRFSLQCLTDFDIRFAFVTGKVATPTAPYAIIRAGMNYWESNLDLTTKTLYFGSPDAGKVAEIIAWA